MDETHQLPVGGAKNGEFQCVRERAMAWAARAAGIDHQEP